MEKFEDSESGIEKIRRIKGAPSWLEEAMLAWLTSRFEQQIPNEKLEQEKTPEEQEILEGIVASMPDFIQEYGGEPIVLKPEYMRVIDPAKMIEEMVEEMTEEQRTRFLSERKNEEGWTIDGNFTAILSQDAKLHEAHTMVHEFLHLQSFMSFTYSKDSERERSAGLKIGGFKIFPRQNGFGIFDEQGKEYFRGLDEAIVEELTMRFDRKYFQKFKPLENELKARAAIEQQVGKPKYEDTKEIAEVFGRHDGDHYVTTIIPYAFTKQRKILRSVISKIYNADKEQYKSEEAVFELFAKAELSGRLLEIARIIEESLGKGAFRKLGEETALAKGESPAEKLM